MKYDVFFYEVFKEEGDLLKKYLPKNLQVGFTYKTVQESKMEEPPSKIISIRTQSKIPGKWANKISGILSRSTGFDHLRHFSEKIPCGYIPQYSDRSVAEQTILLCLALLRKLPKQIKHFSKFDRDNLTGFELYKKNILIVGVGNIGYEIFKISKNLGLEVYGVDIVKKHSDVTYIPIEEGIKGADIIVCSMNLTKDNKKYFNYDLLKKAKRGTIFVNTARGELAPSSDLLRLINEKHLFGLALDVYNKESLLSVGLRNNKLEEDEEIKATMELRKKENVILTPHNSFNTFEAVEKKVLYSVRQLGWFLDKGKFLWEVPQNQ